MRPIRSRVVGATKRGSGAVTRTSSTAAALPRRAAVPRASPTAIRRTARATKRRPQRRCGSQRDGAHDGDLRIPSPRARLARRTAILRQRSCTGRSVLTARRLGLTSRPTRRRVKDSYDYNPSPRRPRSRLQILPLGLRTPGSGRGHRDVCVAAWSAAARDPAGGFAAAPGQGVADAAESQRDALSAGARLRRVS